MSVKVEQNPDHVKARTFFRRILSYGNDAKASTLVVCHLVDSAIAFIPALDERYHIQAFLGKPSSIQAEASQFLSAALPGKEHHLDKGVLKIDPSSVIREVFPSRRGITPEDVVILDIGGYFAQGSSNGKPGLVSVREELEERGYRLAGIVEDTQNGEHRYRDVLRDLGPNGRFTVYSVARSPLKRPENHLVGVAISFSVEAILRQSNIVLQSRRAGVIGFGPIGRSVSHSLRNRGIPVSVCERDPIQLATGAAQGFRVFDYEHHFEEFVRDLNLIVSATGAGASASGIRPINAQTIRYLPEGAYIASVTSQDDEIALEEILVQGAEGYSRRPVRYNPAIEHLTRTDENGNEHGLYLMGHGNAINFEHGGVIGPAIQLLQGEILACVNHILSDKAVPSDQVQELPDSERERVARAWLDQYMSDTSVILH